MMRGVAKLIFKAFGCGVFALWLFPVMKKVKK
jgi:hypothetical protein